MNVFARVDFYPDGKMIPISITDKNGDTMFIDRVTQIERGFDAKGKIKYKYSCNSKRGAFILYYQDNRWMLSSSLD